MKFFNLKIYKLQRTVQVQGNDVQNSLIEKILRIVDQRKTKDFDFSKSLKKIKKKVSFKSIR